MSDKFVSNLKKISHIFIFTKIQWARMNRLSIDYNLLMLKNILYVMLRLSIVKIIKYSLSFNNIRIMSIQK